jgi:hypothetical protein
VSDINTAVVECLKALDPKRPIREADINSGTTPALGSYEGGWYERRQDEGR